ncbi:PepSY domain-containing protein [Curtobacterium sp. 458]|uniref:PepSY domain-containing protein n=1 Tax=Curtobacterium sp. 458 TaxID=3050069 RepID=UPI0025B38879|nr:PepSY domain-containing protein [Curtobacterium sp. 458]WJY00365.1 PepSY domain-containing protein [Curtobacterium sp. 458]
MDTTRFPATARRTALVAAVPLALVLALAGCSTGSTGSSDTGSGSGSGSGSSSNSDGSGTGSSATAERSSAPSGSATADGSALRAAVSTARDAVASGTVIAVEQEAGGSSWEVTVVDRDGGEHAVHTDAAGSRVTAGPTADATDADDVAENRRFVDAADLDVTEAAAKVVDVAPGTVTELGLDDHRGAVVWEADVRGSDGTKHSVRIDAGSGAVVTNTVDTDD